MIFGIGLTPLLQWLILPPVTVGAYRTLGPALFGLHSSQRPIPTPHSEVLVDDLIMNRDIR